MKITFTKILLVLLLMISLVSILSFPVKAFCPPPFAKIDFVSPHDECLNINDETKFCGGSIEIVNKCNKDYFLDEQRLLKQGSALYPSVRDPSWTLKLISDDKSEVIIIRGTSTAENFYASPYSSASSKTSRFSLVNLAILGVIPIALLGLFILIRLKKRNN